MNSFVTLPADLPGFFGPAGVHRPGTVPRDCLMEPLEVERRQVAQRGMTPPRVVQPTTPALDAWPDQSSGI